MRNSTTYKITGTKTFRLSSTKILGKWGSNLQNIEKSMRAIYIPDDGMIFVQTDQAGAEALIVSYMCRDGNYRALFKNGIKPHTYICVHIFKDIWPRKMREHGYIGANDILDMNEIAKIPIAQLKNHPFWKSLDKCIKSSDNWVSNERYYYLGKQTEHSSNYDIKAPTFQMNILEKSGGTIYIPKDKAEFFLATKHALYPEIKEDFHQYVQQMATKHRVLYNLHGHPYQITQYEIRDSDWKEYYSWIPQSTVGEITNIAYSRLQNYTEICCYSGVKVPKPISKEVTKALDKYGSSYFRNDMLANTHDSYLSQCKIEEVMRCANLQKFFIEQSFESPYDGTPFAMKSETCAGFNWRPHHETKNPTGLKEIKL